MFLKKLFHSYQGRKALPAFNLDSFLTYQAVEQAVASTGLPTIVQLSKGEESFLHASRISALVRPARQKGLPIFLNLDHGRDPALVKRCLESGFDMVHFDGSRLPLTENIKISRQLLKATHRSRALLELEFDPIAPTGQKATLTNPSEAYTFIKKTRADLFAVSVGNQHGLKKNHPEHLDLSLLQEIHKSLPKTFLTMHGGSGIPLLELKKAISLGVVKINVNSLLRTTLRTSLEESLSQNKSQKAYDYLTPSLSALTHEITQVLKDFSQP